jgi:hypothetical protein
LKVWSRSDRERTVHHTYVALVNPVYISLISPAFFTIWVCCARVLHLRGPWGPFASVINLLGLEIREVLSIFLLSEKAKRVLHAAYITQRDRNIIALLFV